MPSVNELRTGVAGLGGPVPKRVHLIGVAGSGMSGLAGLLLALGHRVSGSDKVDTAEVRRLQGEGLIYQRSPLRRTRARRRRGNLFLGRQERQRRFRRGRASGNAAHSPRGSVGGIDGGASRHSRRGHAWENDHQFDGCSRVAGWRFAAVPLRRGGNPDPRHQCALGHAGRILRRGRRTKATEPSPCFDPSIPCS